MGDGGCLAAVDPRRASERSASGGASSDPEPASTTDLAGPTGALQDLVSQRARRRCGLSAGDLGEDRAELGDLVAARSASLQMTGERVGLVGFEGIEDEGAGQVFR